MVGSSKKQPRKKKRESESRPAGASPSLARQACLPWIPARRSRLFVVSFRGGLVLFQFAEQARVVAPVAATAAGARRVGVGVDRVRLQLGQHLLGPVKDLL